MGPFEDFATTKSDWDEHIDAKVTIVQASLVESTETENAIQAETLRLSKLADMIGTTFMNRPWRDKAACRGIDPNVFFPIVKGEDEQAKAICVSCSVRQDCLEFAINNGEKDGIWGGANESERRRITASRKPAAR